MLTFGSASMKGYFMMKTFALTWCMWELQPGFGELAFGLLDRSASERSSPTLKKRNEIRIDDVTNTCNSADTILMPNVTVLKLIQN